MGKSAADVKILSYYDTVLRQSDLGILSGPNYLNDRIIEFYFNHLSSTHSLHETLLAAPAIAFWIANCPDTTSLNEFLVPLNLGDKKLIIFPVNDNNDVNLAEGGNHWSLLVYERNSNIFVHHDSYLGSNGRHAMTLYKTVAGCISKIAPRYIEYNESPQQVNGYDCGVYVLATARVICSWWSSRSTSKDEENMLWFTRLKEGVNASSVAEMRKEILDLVRCLMARKCVSSTGPV